KIDMIDFADVIAINKFDKAGSLDALRDVRKQYRRGRNLFDGKDEDLPVHGTIASQFNDPGMNGLYRRLMATLVERTGAPLKSQLDLPVADSEKVHVIPPSRVRYLAEISDACEQYDAFVEAQAGIARRLGQVEGTLEQLRQGLGEREFQVRASDDVVEVREGVRETPAALGELERLRDELRARLDHRASALLEAWPETKTRYRADKYRFEVRGRVLEQDLYTTSLSGTRIPKVSLPRYRDPGDILTWLMQENAPGFFPFTSGVFPLKRQGEAPARMFAGEGGPERTNRRFHYVSRGLPAARLSTAFDSVTLYGEDPDHRPDIYGKVGNSGVSVCSLDDAKKLYSGFDLASPTTSVSMTINGPAPMVLGFFMNAAIDQGCEKHIRAEGAVGEVEAKIAEIYQAKGMPRPAYQGDLPDGNDGLGLMLLGVSGDQVLPRETYERIKTDVMRQVRGTVQADILKEDQAQNTCIFSTEFALRMMGDIQESFTRRGVRNFYSVSISGYHIA
ncbi:MAG: methylmalonyl-CoA mutase family protein, partial [Myxococcota bacterium]